MVGFFQLFSGLIRFIERFRFLVNFRKIIHYLNLLSRRVLILNPIRVNWGLIQFRGWINPCGIYWPQRLDRLRFFLMKKHPWIIFIFFKEILLLILFSYRVNDWRETCFPFHFGLISEPLFLLELFVFLFFELLDDRFEQLVSFQPWILLLSLLLP